jgi:hypothetical protein
MQLNIKTFLRGEARQTNKTFLNKTFLSGETLRDVRRDNPT